MNHYTYLITNRTNDMKYIGVRSCDCNPVDDNYWGSSKYLTEAISNDGIDNFSKEVLKVWPTRDEAVAHEIKLHKKHNVGVNDKFYNKAIQKSVGFDTTGMPGSCGFQGKTHTKESKQKMSESKKGIAKTAEHNKKNSLAHRGENNPFYGQTHTAETIEKIRQASTGKNNPMYGKKHSDEAKQKVSMANKGRKRTKVECPHCKKLGAGPGMKMYHFDNCKAKK